MKSLTAMTGPLRRFNCLVTKALICLSGFNKLWRSTARPSRRNSFQDVTDQTSAAILKSLFNNACAFNAQLTETPDAKICTRLLRHLGAFFNK